jgi:mono/diheme cytochrome c family protein
VQANRGKTLYDEKCAECHGTMKTVTPDMAPLLNDHVFQSAWKDRSLADLFDKIRDTMPPNKAGSVSPQQLVDLIAYLLSANAMPAGDMPLAYDAETLKQLRLEFPSSLVP